MTTGGIRGFPRLTECPLCVPPPLTQMVPPWLDLGFDYQLTYGMGEDADHSLDIRRRRWSRCCHRRCLESLLVHAHRQAAAGTRADWHRGRGTGALVGLRGRSAGMVRAGGRAFLHRSLVGRSCRQASAGPEGQGEHRGRAPQGACVGDRRGGRACTTQGRCLVERSGLLASGCGPSEPGNRSHAAPGPAGGRAVLEPCSRIIRPAGGRREPLWTRYKRLLTTLEGS
jgi:hypothetical protein